MNKPAKQHTPRDTATQNVRQPPRGVLSKDALHSHLRLVEPSQRAVRSSRDDVDDMWDNVPV